MNKKTLQIVAAIYRVISPDVMHLNLYAVIVCHIWIDISIISFVWI